MELWDAYDEHFNKVDGVTLIRDEGFPDGLFHLVVDFMVRHTDGTYLLMQRDLRKHMGGMWELSGGGSALQGEDPVTAVLREMREETGIFAESAIEIGRGLYRDKHSWCIEYIVTTDQPKDSVTLQEGETIAYRWANRDEVLAMNQHELASWRTLRIMREQGL